MRNIRYSITNTGTQPILAFVVLFKFTDGVTVGTITQYRDGWEVAKSISPGSTVPGIDGLALSADHGLKGVVISVPYVQLAAGTHILAGADQYRELIETGRNEVLQEYKETQQVLDQKGVESARSRINDKQPMLPFRKMGARMMLRTAVSGAGEAGLRLELKRLLSQAH